VRDAGTDALVEAEAAADAQPILRACSELPAGAPTGVYRLQPAGRMPFETVCNTEMPGGPWALVYRSKGAERMQPLEFWKILYSARFQRKGLPLEDFFYEPNIYAVGTTYRDVIVDVAGKSAVAFEASAASMNPVTMHFVSPLLRGGDRRIFESQFAAGWSSLDHDDDPKPSNCAFEYGGVTQHYSQCWAYNLGVDEVLTDLKWGPHMQRQILLELGLTAPGMAAYPRIGEVTRWAKW
jgi:hypothetical protein